MLLPAPKLSFWRTAVRFAWRDLRFARHRAVALILSLAIGAALVTAVQALTSEMRTRLRGEAREWIAADILVQLRDPPQPDDLAALGNIDHTVVTGTFGMAASDHAPEPLLVYLRVVDPTRYPFYGTIRLTSGQSLAEALQPHTLVVSPEGMRELRLQPGDSLQLGKATFRVAAAILSEPGWEVGISTFLPHVLLNYEAFDRARIAAAGVEADYRLLIRLGTRNLNDTREQMATVFPTADLLDYRDPSPKAAKAFDLAADFLRIAAILALLCGAVSAAFILYLQTERRLNSAAILKTLGASRRLVITILAIETVGFALLAGCIAAIAGPVLERILGGLANRSLPIDLKAAWHWTHTLEAVALALVVAAPASIGPLVRLRRLSPLAILRRHVTNASLPPRRNTQRSLWRLGIRNLFLPSHYTGSTIAALSLGTAMVSATYITQTKVSEAVARTVPARGANVFLIGAHREQLDHALNWLHSNGRIRATPQTFPLIWLRVTNNNRIAGEWLATCNNQTPPGEIVLSRDAEILGKPGEILHFTAKGRAFQGRVATRAIDYISDAISMLTFHCQAFENVPVFYHAAISVTSGEEQAIRRELAARFPALPTMSTADFARTVQALADNAMAMTRIACWQIVFLGVGLVVIMVSISWRVRLEEVALWKALGARPAQLTSLFVIEFGAAGFLAGVSGACAAVALASLVLSQLLHQATFAFDGMTFLLTIAITTALSSLTGAAAGRTALRRKPLPLLRDE